MQDSTFEIDQVLKLREIERARMRRGETGLRMEIQALIMRLQSGGVGSTSDDLRVVQAKRVWDKGFGQEQRFYSFDAYLETIPEIPEELKAHDERFPELVLVDARLGVVTTCKLLGVYFDGTDQTFRDRDPEKVRVEKVYWIRLQDGAKSRGKMAATCRSEFAKDEIGLTVHEGLAYFAQSHESFRGWGLNITDSVHRDYPDVSAGLDWFRDRPDLFWYSDGDESEYYGSGSRRA